MLAAGVERVTPEGLKKLLRDGSLANLVGHQKKLAEPSVEARLGQVETAALARAAGD